MFKNKTAKHLHYGFPVVSFINSPSQTEEYFARHGHKNLKPQLRLTKLLLCILRGLADNQYTAVIDKEGCAPSLYVFGYWYSGFYLG